ncbi:MAG: hypothetical protein Q9195_005129 [Heterodermia aff. obscurata]
MACKGHGIASLKIPSQNATLPALRNMSDSSSSSPFQSAQTRQESVANSQSHRSSSSSSALPAYPSSHASPTSTSDQPESPPHLPPTVQDPPSTSSSSSSALESSPSLPLPPTRPNKYHGPPSTWRKWTAPERELAASLDQIQAADLSIHLYNAFALKRRAGARPSRRKRKHDDNEDATSNWVPPKVWTAWPMRPDEVPREEETRDWEDDNPAPRKKRPKPSSLLNELLVARVLQEAKERFEAREWAPDNTSPEPTTTHSTDHSPTQNPKPKRRKKPQFTYTGNEEPSPPGAPLTYSAIHNTLPNPPPLKPATLADDALATTLLQPATRHILAQLDALLLALHTARASYARPRSSHRPAKSKSTYKASFAPLDWSSVLGFASLSGWDAAVVQRAGERCGAVFGEGMAVRRFDVREKRAGEGGVLRLINGKGGEEGDGGDEDGDEEEMYNGVHVDGFLQPIEGKRWWGGWKRSTGSSRGRRVKIEEEEEEEEEL